MKTLDYLSKLIAFDTRNPPGSDAALIGYLTEELQRDSLAKPDQVERVSVDGDKHSYVYAIYGEPKKLINVHADTVPDNAGWSGSPFELRIKDDRAYGLGTADTKGNMAVLLNLLNQCRPKDAMILFSGDEENAGSCCVRAFLKTEICKSIEKAIICEPTNLKIGTQHRGYVKFRLTSEGEGGHSSRADELKSPLVETCRIAVILDELGKKYLKAGSDPFYGLCLNVGKISGGVAANVIPSRVELVGSLRPPYGFDVDAFLGEAEETFRRQGLEREILQIFHGPAFKTRDVSAFRAAFAERFAEQVHLDFWTETALFERQGINSVVFGPGSVCQAHGPDEYVKIPDLAAAEAVYKRFLCE